MDRSINSLLRVRLFTGDRIFFNGRIVLLSCKKVVRLPLKPRNAHEKASLVEILKSGERVEKNTRCPVHCQDTATVQSSQNIKITDLKENNGQHVLDSKLSKEWNFGYQSAFTFQITQNNKLLLTVPYSYNVPVSRKGSVINWPPGSGSVSLQ